MAASIVTILVNWYWDRDDPDGSKCVLCGDACYLTMWRLFVTTDKPVSQSATDVCACDSCHRVLMEREE